MQNKQVLYIIWGFLFCCFLFSCSRDEYVISKDKMSDVMYDIQLAQTIMRIKYGEFSTEEQKQATINGVLAKHGITQQELDSSLVWYSDHIDVYLKISDSISARLKREQLVYEAKFNEQLARENVISDFPSFYHLTVLSPRFTFNIDSLKAERLNIASVYSLDYSFLGMSSISKLKAYYVLEYSDTLIVGSEYITDESGSLIINHLDDRRVKNFSGYIGVDSITIPNYNILLYNLKLNKEVITSEQFLEKMSETATRVD